MIDLAKNAKQSRMALDPGKDGYGDNGRWIFLKMSLQSSRIDSEAEF
jgi:hypothetical protein